MEQMGRLVWVMIGFWLGYNYSYKLGVVIIEKHSNVVGLLHYVCIYLLIYNPYPFYKAGPASHHCWMPLMLENLDVSLRAELNWIFTHQSCYYIYYHNFFQCMHLTKCNI